MLNLGYTKYEPGYLENLEYLGQSSVAREQEAGLAKLYGERGRIGRPSPRRRNIDKAAVASEVEEATSGIEEYMELTGLGGSAVLPRSTKAGSDLRAIMKSQGYTQNPTTGSWVLERDLAGLPPHLGGTAAPSRTLADEMTAGAGSTTRTTSEVNFLNKIATDEKYRKEVFKSAKIKSYKPNDPSHIKKLLEWHAKNAE